MRGAINVKPTRESVGDTDDLTQTVVDQYQTIKELDGARPAAKSPALKSITLPTFAAMRQVVGDVDGERGPRACIVTGRTALFDGYEGVFAWDETFVGVDDDASTIRPPARTKGGRWRRTVWSGRNISVPTPASDNPRPFVRQLTGTGPWDFTGLTGDATGLRGYEFVYRFTKAGAGAFEIGLRFNNDSGAAKYVTTVAGSSIIVGGGGLGGTNQVVAGTLSVPVSASGAYRTVLMPSVVVDNTPQSVAYDNPSGAWLDTAAITQATFIMRSGTVDGGTIALYEMRDRT